MKNKYKVLGDTTIIYVRGENGQIHEALIDTEDLELVKWIDGSWYYAGERMKYVRGRLGDQQILLHRLVMRALNMFNKEIDHINHNILDNRKSQLRIVTKSENQQNRRLASNNRSGVTGVFYNPENKRWIARIGVDGKKIDLGTYKKKEDAIKARKAGEKKYHKYKQSILEYQK